MNGNISLSVLNQDTQEVETFIIPYIVTSHVFSINYVYEDTKTVYTPSNNTIFMTDVKAKGLMAALNYSVSVDLIGSGYNYQDWEGNRWHVSQERGMIKTYPDGTTEIIYQPGEVPSDRLIQSKSNNTIYIDLCSETSIVDFLSNNDNAKYVQFLLDIDITLDGNPHPEEIDQLSLKDNLIPSGMYLKMMTSAGSLFESRQVDTMVS